MSLSARRAWIEMQGNIRGKCVCCVALRKESVDRNKYVVQCRKVMGVSLSARRAWIEILRQLQSALCGRVALRKESVDRNPIVPVELTTLVSRSPQGERG